MRSDRCRCGDCEHVVEGTRGDLAAETVAGEDDVVDEHVESLPAQAILGHQQPATRQRAGRGGEAVRQVVEAVFPAGLKALLK